MFWAQRPWACPLPRLRFLLTLFYQFSLPFFLSPSQKRLFHFTMVTEVPLAHTPLTRTAHINSSYVLRPLTPDSPFRSSNELQARERREQGAPVDWTPLVAFLSGPDSWCSLERGGQYRLEGSVGKCSTRLELIKRSCWRLSQLALCKLPCLLPALRPHLTLTSAPLGSGPTSYLEPFPASFCPRRESGSHWDNPCDRFSCIHFGTEACAFWGCKGLESLILPRVRTETCGPLGTRLWPV